MFILCCMKDTIRIKPYLFRLDIHHVIEEQLNKKFANKVVHNVGLCVGVYDILSISDSYVLPGDGSSFTSGTMKFTGILFSKIRHNVNELRVYDKDEILIGRLRSCNQEGIHVSLEFFDEIFIPREMLQHPSKFDFEEQLWLWEYQTENKVHDLFMDLNKEVRLRVVDHIFADSAPVSDTAKEDNENENCNSSKSPYTIIGTINHPGLGLVSWWNN